MNSRGSEFWELMAQSIIVQGLLTLGVVGTALYLVVQGLPVPEWLQNVTFAIVAFFFGARMQKASYDAAIAAINRLP